MKDLKDSIRLQGEWSMWKCRKTSPLVPTLALLSNLVYWGAPAASAATNQFRGVNWADPRDNFQSGVVYVSGLSSSDTNSSASATAASVMDQFISKLGANSVRLPINEATVSKYWGTYTGVIDTIAAKGKAVLCYWHPGHGVKIPDMTAFWAMWKTVTDKYGGSDNVYFEVQNEPNMYSVTELRDLYNNWLTQYPTIPKGRVILDGSGMAQNVPDIGNDSRFKDCLLAVHDYSMWGGFESWTTESQWMDHLKSEVGTYSDRTVCTEWGGPMSPGSKNGVSYGSLDYSKAPTNYFEAYLRGMGNQLRAWNMGSFYWAGLKDGDWYTMTTKSGSGSNITLSIPNQSGLERMQYSWTTTPGAGESDGGTATGGAGGNVGTTGDGGADTRGPGGAMGTGGAGTGGTSTVGGGGSAGTTATGTGGASATSGGTTNPSPMGGSSAPGGRTGFGGTSGTGGAIGTGGAGGPSSSASSGGTISTAGNSGGNTSGGGGANISAGALGGNGGEGGSSGANTATAGSGGSTRSSANASEAPGCACHIGRGSGTPMRLIGSLLCLTMLAWQWKRRRRRIGS